MQCVHCLFIFQVSKHQIIMRGLASPPTLSSDKYIFIYIAVPKPFKTKKKRFFFVLPWTHLTNLVLSYWISIVTLLPLVFFFFFFSFKGQLRKDNKLLNIVVQTNFVVSAPCRRHTHMSSSLNHKPDSDPEISYSRLNRKQPNSIIMSRLVSSRCLFVWIHLKFIKQ